MTRLGRTGFGISAVAVLAASSFAAPAWADNEQQVLTASSCDTLGCTTDNKSKVGSPLGGFVSAGAAQASASGWQGGLVTATAGFFNSAQTTAGNFVERVASVLSYTFQAVGAPNTLVPVRIHGVASISPIQASTETGGTLIVDSMGMPSGTSFFQISSSATINVSGFGRPAGLNANGPVGAAVSLGNMLDQGRGDLNLAGSEGLIDQTYWFMSDTDISVSIAALAALNYSGYQTNNAIFGSVRASADPTFTIDDPAYAAFSIVGVPNDAPPSTPAPEPATWAMLIAGFGLIGAAMRRKRLHTLPAAI